MSAATLAAVPIVRIAARRETLELFSRPDASSFMVRALQGNGICPETLLMIGPASQQRETLSASRPNVIFGGNGTGQGAEHVEIPIIEALTGERHCCFARSLGERRRAVRLSTRLLGWRCGLGP